MNAKTRQMLLDAQSELENCPSGGVGRDGETQEALDAAVKEGRPVLDDANYHMAQQVWLLIEQVLKEKSTP